MKSGPYIRGRETRNSHKDSNRLGDQIVACTMSFCGSWIGNWSLKFSDLIGELSTCSIMKNKHTHDQKEFCKAAVRSSVCQVDDRMIQSLHPPRSAPEKKACLKEWSTLSLTFVYNPIDIDLDTASRETEWSLAESPLAKNITTQTAWRLVNSGNTWGRLIKTPNHGSSLRVTGWMGNLSYIYEALLVSIILGSGLRPGRNDGSQHLSLLEDVDSHIWLSKWL